MARGAFALGADILDQTTALVGKAKRSRAMIQLLGRLLADEVMCTVRQAQRIQNSLYDPWSF